jgi:hypothetical protein
VTSKRRPTKSTPSPPPSPEAIWLKLPLPPEDVATLRGHVDTIAGLVSTGRELLSHARSAEDAVTSLVGGALKALVALERDAKRIGRRRRQRRRRSR